MTRAEELYAAYIQDMTNEVYDPTTEPTNERTGHTWLCECPECTGDDVDVDRYLDDYDEDPL